MKVMMFISLILIIDVAILQTAIIVLYVIVITVGVVGNLLVILTIIRSPILQTRTNMFIINMALADIIICLVAAPITPVTAFSGSWHFGPRLCSLVPLVQGTSVYVSTLSLTSVAVDRYLVVTRSPMSQLQHESVSSAVVSILVMDSLALLATLPYSGHMTWSRDTGVEECWEHWQHGEQRQVSVYHGVMVSDQCDAGVRCVPHDDSVRPPSPGQQPRLHHDHQQAVSEDRSGESRSWEEHHQVINILKHELYD